jgi:hypothetical protein
MLQPQTHSPGEPHSRETATAPRPPLCPLCAGRLVALHNTYRCLRCRFSLCVGCEGGEVCPAPGR